MKTDDSLLRGKVPRLVLSLLKSGEKHGYEMISMLEEMGCELFRQREASLYPVLHGLERKGLVRACICTHAPGRPRRCYRLTARGAARLQKTNGADTPEGREK